MSSGVFNNCPKVIVYIPGGTNYYNESGYDYSNNVTAGRPIVDFVPQTESTKLDVDYVSGLRGLEYSGDTGTFPRLYYVRNSSNNAYLVGFNRGGISDTSNGATAAGAPALTGNTYAMIIPKLLSDRPVVAIFI
ncbi:MAG: hypothetical protein EZS28_040860 [Streblomastix strix]|uniref:Uncharacterized protein n=1 Tax=Streblomastix strix TaxID=222440 RepID=A0A5J4TZI8_9EUKA|nr:MAG: hypothetical protein EZS28_040860 [Streblomastix strix]